MSYQLLLTLASPGAACAPAPVPAKVTLGAGTKLYEYATGTPPTGTATSCGAETYGAVDTAPDPVVTDVSGQPLILVDATTNQWQLFNLPASLTPPAYVWLVGSLWIDADGDGCPYQAGLDAVYVP